MVAQPGLALLETNYADLSFLFTLDHGDAVSPHLGKDARVTDLRIRLGRRSGIVPEWPMLFSPSGTPS